MNIYNITNSIVATMYQLDEEISQAEERVNALLTATGGEVTLEVEEAQNELTSLEATRAAAEDEAVRDIRSTVESLASWRANVIAEQTAIKEQERRLLARRKSLERTEAWLKGCILYGMQAAGEKKIKTPFFTISRSSRESLVVDEPTVLKPYTDSLRDIIAGFPAYISVNYSINKTILKQESNLPEGCSFQSNESVSIR